MKQLCYLWSIWLTWLALPALAGVGFLSFGWLGALAIVAAGLIWQIVYIRLFPRLSSSMGYGSVADVPANSTATPPLAPLNITLYTASACPFCPLVRRRLAALQPQLGFSMTEIDVTFRPGLISAKKLKAVPTVEVNGRLHAGNMTSAELLAFLTEALPLGA